MHMQSIYHGSQCMQYVYAIQLSYITMQYAYAIHVSCITMQYVYAIQLSYITMQYVYAIHVSCITMQYVYCIACNPLPIGKVHAPVALSSSNSVDIIGRSFCLHSSLDMKPVSSCNSQTCQDIIINSNQD